MLKQRSYTGNQPVISSALADTPCTVLGIDGVVAKLNATLGTSYTLGSRILRLLGIATLESILKPYVARNVDFGTVYAHLRPYWYYYDVAAIAHELHTREEKDREMRREVLVHDRITRRNVHPRRVWDLYANRVVPYWVAGRIPWGISHAWVDEKDRVDVMTPINACEWHVPMPKDANLDLIRIEMLNLGAEYAWLDVLCLRQEGGKNEHLRLEEWKLDVPTIGWVYRGLHVVCYFNGLGQPLHLTPNYFESDRCWFRRAWTLQEFTNNVIIGGETGDHDIMEKEVQKVFDEQLAHLRKIRQQDMVLELVLEMQNRVSTKSLDKVAGLAYLLYPEFIPIYDAEKSDVDAWEVLMDAMSPASRARLFFYFPEPGKGNKHWRPSWQQIMAFKYFAPYLCSWPGPVNHTDDTDADWYEGFCIDFVDVCGLAEGEKERNHQEGEMVFNDAAGSHHTFKIVAAHTYPIPNGSYTLIGCNDTCNLPVDIWVVGQQREDGKFEKLSVFRSADEQVRLMELGLEKSRIFLC